VHRGNGAIEDPAAGWLLSIARDVLLDSVRRGASKSARGASLGCNRSCCTMRISRASQAWTKEQGHEGVVYKRANAR
jgi:predicted RNA polymerase sigma factor